MFDCFLLLRSILFVCLFLTLALATLIVQLIVFGMFQSQQSKMKLFINRSMQYKACCLSLKAC